MTIVEITGGMLRAARSLTGLSQQELADRASISRSIHPPASPRFTAHSVRSIMGLARARIVLLAHWTTRNEGTGQPWRLVRLLVSRPARAAAGGALEVCACSRGGDPNFRRLARAQLAAPFLLPHRPPLPCRRHHWDRAVGGPVGDGHPVDHALGRDCRSHVHCSQGFSRATANCPDSFRIGLLSALLRHFASLRRLLEETYEASRRLTVQSEVFSMCCE